MSDQPQKREDTPEVADWLRLSGMLISAASDYAASGQEDEALSAMMRKIQVTAAALNAALTAVNQAGLGRAPQRPFNLVTHTTPIQPPPQQPGSHSH